MQLRESRDQIRDELFGELQNDAPALDHNVFRQIANPIVREVRSRHHKVARRKLADEIADEIHARRIGHQMYFVFGVKMPSHRVVRISVRPNFERFVLSNLYEFQVWLHLLILPKGRKPQQSAVTALQRRTQQNVVGGRPLSRLAFLPTLDFSNVTNFSCIRYPLSAK